ncbi:MAG: helix-turn-helix transcriptional regulator [Acidaminococcaceae bacterium]
MSIKVLAALDYNKIGLRLRQVRSSLTQKEFAASLGVSISYIKSCENGKKGSIELFAEIAKKYNISLDWLLLGTEKSTKAQLPTTSAAQDNTFIAILQEALNDPKYHAWATMQFRYAFNDYMVEIEQKKLQIKKETDVSSI